MSDWLNGVDNDHVNERIHTVVMSEWVNEWDSEIRNKSEWVGSVCVHGVCMCNTCNVFIW